MRTCDEILELMSAALDDQLSAAEQAELDAHLTCCPACSALFADLRGLHEASSQLEDVPAPAGFADQIMARISTDPAQDQPDNVIAFPAKKAASRPWKKWTASAAVIAIVVLGAIALPGQLGGFGNSSNSTADSAAFDTAAPAASEWAVTDSASVADGDMPAEASMEINDVIMFQDAGGENGRNKLENQLAEPEAALEDSVQEQDGIKYTATTSLSASYCGTLTLTEDSLPDGLDGFTSFSDSNGNLNYVVPADYFFSLVQDLSAEKNKNFSHSLVDAGAEYGLIIVTESP